MIKKVASFLFFEKGPNPILKFWNSFEICSPKVVVLVAINPYEGMVHSTGSSRPLVEKIVWTWNVDQRKLNGHPVLWRFFLGLRFLKGNLSGDGLFPQWIRVFQIILESLPAI